MDELRAELLAHTIAKVRVSRPGSPGTRTPPGLCFNPLTQESFSMSNQVIAFSVADGIARIVIDDAARHNVVGAQFTKEFARAAIACEGQDDIRVVLLTANGKVFSVGGDLQ